MDRNILIVDDQRDILRLLRSALDTLKLKKTRIYETPSGEEALLESTRNKIDLLISDYKLPGMSGIELMNKIRVRHPDVKIIFITGIADREVREEMLNAGVMAVFDKPIPLTDFLDVVERSLGLKQTIFPPEGANAKTAELHSRISDLLANFRQEIKAEAVFLLNDHGLVQARTGKLHDGSMEVSLIATLMAIHGASLKIARHNHQETINSYHVFSGGDHDLLFIPVTPLYALLVAGSNLAAQERILESVGAIVALRDQVERSLKSIDATAEPHLPSAEDVKPASLSAPEPEPVQAAEPPADVEPSPEMEALLKNAPHTKPDTSATNDFWDQAVDSLVNKPVTADVISMEDARKLGLIPGGN